MWLIALAVPIQGSAAVTMFGCGPDHHGGMSMSQVKVSEEVAQDADHHDRGAGVEGSTGHQHADGSIHDHADSFSAHGGAHKAVKGNCTPCASCCAVAALPATIINFAPVPLVDFFVGFAPSSVTSFLAEGLERPPRLFLV